MLSCYYYCCCCLTLLLLHRLLHRRSSAGWSSAVLCAPPLPAPTPNNNWKWPACYTDHCQRSKDGNNVSLTTGQVKRCGVARSVDSIDLSGAACTPMHMQDGLSVDTTHLVHSS